MRKKRKKNRKIPENRSLGGSVPNRNLRKKKKKRPSIFLIVFAVFLILWILIVLALMVRSVFFSPHQVDPVHRHHHHHRDSITK